MTTVGLALTLVALTRPWEPCKHLLVFGLFADAHKVVATKPTRSLMTPPPNARTVFRVHFCTTRKFSMAAFPWHDLDVSLGGMTWVMKWSAVDEPG